MSTLLNNILNTSSTKTTKSPASSFISPFPVVNGVRTEESKKLLQQKRFFKTKVDISFAPEALV